MAKRGVSADCDPTSAMRRMPTGGDGGLWDHRAKVLNTSLATPSSSERLVQTKLSSLTNGSAASGEPVTASHSTMQPLHSSPPLRTAPAGRRLRPHVRAPLPFVAFAALVAYGVARHPAAFEALLAHGVAVHPAAFEALLAHGVAWHPAAFEALFAYGVAWHPAAFEALFADGVAWHPAAFEALVADGVARLLNTPALKLYLSWNVSDVM
eukprot:gene7179-6608_t